MRCCGVFFQNYPMRCESGRFYMFNKLSCCTGLSYRGVSKAKGGTNLTGSSTGRVRGLNPNDTLMGGVRMGGRGVTPIQKGQGCLLEIYWVLWAWLKMFLNPKEIPILKQYIMFRHIFQRYSKRVKQKLPLCTL